jgi:hypothetical protein
MDIDDESINSHTPIKIPKKRGRKPKKKLSNSTEEKKIPKKRGRKPKNKIKEKKIPKKRGRKPTGKILSLQKGEITRIENDENCIIAHIPLQASDIEKYSKKSSNTEDSELNIYTGSSIIENNSTENSNNELSFDNPVIFNQKKEKSDKNSENKYIKHLEKKIEKLKEKLEYHNDKNTSTEVFSNDYNIEKVINNLINVEDNKCVMNKKSELHCWWCCHKFDNIPFPLPNKFYKEKFFVFGNFCSASCALSYNLDMQDHKIWERTSLIVKLYNLLTDNNIDTINPSLPRQSLDIFGGTYNINEFRENSMKIYNSRFIIPPMVPIITLIEESYKERNTYKWDKKVNISRYNKLTKNIKLKRNKPLNNKSNNLEKIMGLRKIRISD